MANEIISIEKQIRHCEEMAAEFAATGETELYLECRSLIQDLKWKEARPAIEWHFAVFQ